MKKWITSAAIFAAAFSPQLAYAAEEGGAERGSWSLLTFFAINFVIFVWALVHFAAPAARKFLSDRATTIRTGLSRAEKAFAEAQGLANRAAARMAALAAELKKLGDELDQETGFQLARIRELANSTTERIKHDTAISSAAMSEAARRRVRAQLAESAASLARDLIGRNFEAADQGRLIDGFMDKISSGARQ